MGLYYLFVLWLGGVGLAAVVGYVCGVHFERYKEGGS